MSRNGKIKAKIILIWLSVCFMGGIEFFSESCMLQIAALIITYLLMALRVRFDIFHPYVWYGGALTIYSIGYPVLYLLGADVSRGYTREPLIMSWIALAIIIIMVPSYSIKSDISFLKRDYFPKNLITLSVIYILCCIFMITRSGLANKAEIYAQNNKFFTIAFVWVYLLLVFYTYSFSVFKYTTGKINTILLIEIAIAAIGLSLFSGERDIMLNFALVTVLLLFYWRVISWKQLIVIIILGILLLPLTSIYKYYFLSGAKGTGAALGFDLKSILINFFRGEFESASRNLQLLVNNEEITKGIMFGKTYISDIIRIFGHAPWSCITWFMNEFFATSKYGQGFTAIGEGYINFGYFGIILEFIIIGAMLSYMYKRHCQNIWWLTLYISSFAIFIYAVRADLANIFSPMCRHVLLGLLILKIYNAFCCRKKNEI